MIKRIISKIKRTATPYLTFDKKGKFSSIPFEFTKYKRLIVLESTFGWDGIMMQRPQQVAASFDSETLVLYHSSKDIYKDSSRFKKIKDGLFVLNLDVYRDILINEAKKIDEKLLIVYSTDPTSLSTIEKYKDGGFNLVYEYVDDMNPSLSSPRVYKKLLIKHKYILEKKVKAVCTATRLYEGIKDKTEAALITNGCDYDHFKATKRPCPDDMKFNSGKPVIGYYGAVAEWMDYDLLRKISETDKYEIVLLGISYDGTFEQSGLDRLSNVHFLGKKSYGDLPAYAAHFDVCTIPFVCNELTESTSPVKLFEYMAAEKPIVTTDLAECRKYSSVMCAKDHESFICLLDKAIESAKSPEYRKQLKEDALANTWQSKCKDILYFANAK